MVSIIVVRPVDLKKGTCLKPGSVRKGICQKLSTCKINLWQLYVVVGFVFRLIRWQLNMF